MANNSKKRSKAKTAQKKIPASVIIACIVIVLMFAMCVVAIVQLASDGTSSSDAPPTGNGNATSYLETSYGEFKKECAYAEIEMMDGGKIVLELYPDVAPITVANFLNLANDGFYDGLIFHRVINNFMIQGGDPLGTGLGGSKETIFGEFASNGFENNLSHKRGVISMARKSVPNDSASSQFFICHADSPHLDGDYAAFGTVISGMDVVDYIASVPTNSNNKPYEDIVMKTVRVLQGIPEGE